MQIIYLALAKFFKDSIFLNLLSCTENRNQELGSIMFWDTGNFLVYDFWTPPIPSYQFCTWVWQVVS